jgi:hypothetical protein
VTVVNAVTEATASGVGKIGPSRLGKPTGHGPVKTNVAWIVATGTSGLTPAQGVAIGAIGASPEATDPRAIPHLVRKWIAECARAQIRVDGTSPPCVTVAQEARVASREVAPDRVSADLNPTVL